MSKGWGRVPPDGGWGYGAVIGMTQSMLLFGLAVRSYGVIYLITLEKFQTSATVAAWVGATNVLMFGAASPIAAYCCQRFSCRIVAAIGTMFLSLSFVMSAYAFHVAMLYVSFGVLCGIGIAWTTTPGFLIVSMYFEKNRALATSLGSAGASLSVFVMPPLTNFLYNYYGYWGCMMILAGMSLQGMVSAALFKPLDKYDKPKQQKPKMFELQKLEQNSKVKKLGSQENVCKQLLNEQVSVSLTNSNEEQDNKKTIFEFFTETLSKPLVIGILLTNIGMTMVATTANTFAPASAVDTGISQTYAVLLLSWAGLSDTIGRIVIAAIMDRFTSWRLWIYTGCTVLGSVAVFVFPLWENYGWYTFSMVLYEGNIGVCFAQRTTVLADVVGLKKMPLLFGALQTVNALGVTFGRGIGGIVKDTFGTYTYVFYISGLVSLVLCAVTFVLLVQDYKTNYEESHENTHDHPETKDEDKSSKTEPS